MIQEREKMAALAEKLKAANNSRMPSRGRNGGGDRNSSDQPGGGRSAALVAS